MSSIQQDMKVPSTKPPLPRTSNEQADSTPNSSRAKELAKLASLLPTKTSLIKLTAGKNNNSVLVRVLRIWEARNFKQNGTLMSLDMLLIDEEDTLIQGSIYYRRIHMFKDMLKDGNIYLINNFEVVNSYSHYKVTDNAFTIRFTDITRVFEAPEETCSIKQERFRIHSYAEFQTFAGTNIHLLDVIGRVLSVQGNSLDDPECTHKILMLLLLDDNSTIRLTLWDEQASDFRRQLQKSDQADVVLVCTCMNPKMFAGKLHLNSSGSTKIYVNAELEVVKAFMQRMGIDDKKSPTKIVDEDRDLEYWNIQEILDYISTGVNQEKEVICRAKIVDINGSGGWKYLSCGACSKKLGRTATALICNHCETTTTIGVAKFRVELIVQSGDRTATFVLFDRDAKKISNTTAEEITLREGNETQTGSSSQTVPQCLLDQIGKTMAFHVKISTYNFETSAQTFTVIRIIKEKPINEIESGGINQKVLLNIKTEDGETGPTFKSIGKAKETVVGEDGGPIKLDEELNDTNQPDAKKRRIEQN